MRGPSLKAGLLSTTVSTAMSTDWFAELHSLHVILLCAHPQYPLVVSATLKEEIDHANMGGIKHVAPK